MKSVKEKIKLHLDNHIIEKKISDMVVDIVQVYVQLPVINKNQNIFFQLANKMNMKEIL